jgi:Putative DNA-binding domain
LPALAEIQSRMRDAVVAGEAAGIESLLVGGQFGRRRLEIHCRQYEVSLMNTLVEKFPGCGWLVGTLFVAEAARHYIRWHPPEKPCIAAYGAGFPQFLADCPGAGRVPYLRDFAELEWRVGQVAIAIDEAAISFAELAAVSEDALPDLVLSLQPGICYLEAGWPADELMELYLAETAPESLVFEPFSVWLEIRGARGEFSAARLDWSDFVFRQAISHGQSIGEAVECALGRDAAFDPGAALAGLFAAGLVTAIAGRGCQ